MHSNLSISPQKLLFAPLQRKHSLASQKIVAGYVPVVLFRMHSSVTVDCK